MLTVSFACFAMGWVGGGDAKVAAGAALWFGFGELMNYLLYASLIGGALSAALVAAGVGKGVRVGVPKEIKTHEYRVGLTPSAVREYVAHGHKVAVQSGAGAGIMATDAAYRAAGASIVKTAEEIFAKSDMVVKVKEPQGTELDLLRSMSAHLRISFERCPDLFL